MEKHLLTLLLSLFPLSQVGWSWKVQRMHDPNVLKENHHHHLNPLHGRHIQWHLFINFII